MSRSVTRDGLRGHVLACETCRAKPPPVEKIEAVLAAGRVGVDVGALSQRTMVQLRPELTRRARRAYGREVAAAVLVGLLPLPAVLLYNAYVLSLVYRAATMVLPAGVALYVVATYAAFLVLLCGITYAAVPLLMGRQYRWSAAAVPT